MYRAISIRCVLILSDYYYFAAEHLQKVNRREEEKDS